MDIEDLRADLEALFNPEAEDYGERPTGDIPHPRLEKEHGLDLSYLETFNWEGSSIHPHTRLCPPDEPRIRPLIHNLDVPSRLLEAGLRLFGDSILAYHELKKRTGELRYYPPAILTFWGGFETFVRHTSELMLITVQNVPELVGRFLRDEETFVDRKGDLATRTRYQSVLDRYVVLLRYGYGYSVDRGSKHWQRLEEARMLRDYYTHLDVHDPRSISADQVLNFMEAVLLGIIWPSAEIKRTQLLGIYRLYWMWDSLRKLASPFVEQPFFKDWPLDGPHTIYCPFEGVDTERFPNSEEEREHPKTETG
ncbi:MAG TPA: hypothetical protein DCZ05_00805 [Deltaproteobacteria bacterium]|nr:hypothetical protein [Deltaproteobacteria bacterium]